MKLIIESHPNREVLTIHADVEVTNIQYAEIRRNGSGNEYYRNSNYTTRELLKALVSIPGIEEVKANGAYDIRLEKGLCFSWGEIEPYIVRAFKNVFNDTAKVERKNG